MDKPRFKWIYILSFLIPVFFLNLIFLISGIFPFGASSLLQGDLNFQYISYLSYFRDSILSGQFNNFLYSFSMSLGNTMVGLDAYYLLNPLFVILLFFKSSTLPVAIYFITNLSIGIIGTIMFFYCKHSRRVQLNDYFSLIFSLSYALSSYTIIYMSNIMWLPGVALLPLIAYGIEVLINDGKGKIYFFSLAFAILFNFYIGYMLCIFSFLFFVYNWMILNPINLSQLKKTFPIIGKYIYLSISTVLINMIVLLPTIQATALAKSSQTPTDFAFHSLVNPFLVIRSLLLINNTQIGLPNIYCGLIIAVLVLHYFLNSEIKLRDKSISFSFITIIYLGLQFQTFSVIWHVFKSPLGFPHRFSFIMSFTLIYFAMISIKNTKKIKESIGHSIKLFTILSITNLISILSLYYANIQTSTKALLSSMIIIAFYLILINVVIRNKGLLRRVAFLFMVVILGTELFITGQRSYTAADRNFNQYEYSTYVSKNQEIIESIHQNDLSFYRLEKNYLRDSAAFNDSLLLNYHGISHYSSSLDINTRIGLQYLGYTSFDSIWPSWINYNNGGTIASDTLLGVKYFLSNTNNNNGSIAYFNDSTFVNDGIKVFTNPFFLGIGITASDQLLHLPPQSNNLFTNQNKIWDAFIGRNNTPIFQPIQFKTSFHNVRISDGRLNKINTQKEAFIDLSYTSNIDPAYLYFGNNNKYVNLSQQFQMVQAKSQMDYPTYSNNGIIPLEKNKPNQQTHIKLVVNNPIDYPEIMLYKLDIKRFSTMISNLKKNPLHISEYSNTHINSEINNTKKKKYLFLSIPYDRNWSISVNNKRVATKKVLNNFIAVPLGSGRNHIEMSYVNSSIIHGTIISGLWFIWMIVSFSIHSKRSLKKRHNKMRNAD
ncbi:YfhO family protein [Sporolactobacillus terrae]|uniref:YfhO family protein n=1 Tax=Sporolactobacillus terrae TaxID=269673 RepID=A0ABX5Q4K5_9BACL|nr:YfhO family protein [Sporolactobacillus terrae]QAA21564.1 hypothetical protein C0674_02385 [Sporolactobacillus terrae]QAA24536.1 hypothetical protein C0679_02365 [Sporolactobacillus terrae]